jgi:adenylate kinase
MTLSVVFLGPPGAGKGTQAAALADRFGFIPVNSGALLREEVETGTRMGQVAAAYMERGDLVPDEIVTAVVLRRVAGHSGHRMVLDGFPKTTAQAVAMRDALTAARSPARLAVEFAIDRDVLRQRLLRRARQQHRTDDRPATIGRRLAAFATTPAPLLDFYRDEGILATVDASPTPVEVASALTALVAAAIDRT